MSSDAMHVEPKKPEISQVDRRLLVLAAAGPLAWLTQLGFGISTVRWMCALDTRLPLYLVTAAALAATAAAVAGCWRRTRRGELPDGDPPETGARRALAWSGVVLGGFFLLLVMATLVPGLFLEPCR